MHVEIMNKEDTASYADGNAICNCMKVLIYFTI